MTLAPEIMNEVFDIIKCPYPLRNELRFNSQNAAFVGSRKWTWMPSELKEIRHEINLSEK